MALQYVNLACTKAARVIDTSPTTNEHGAIKYQLAGPNAHSRYTYLLLDFEDLPAEYRYRTIYMAYFKFTAERNLSSTATLFLRTLRDDFNENTVTWNTKPGNGTLFYAGASVGNGSGEVDGSLTLYLTSAKNDNREAALLALDAPSFALYCASSVSSARYLDVYSKAASSSLRPYLQIALDENNAAVKTTLTSPTYSDRPNVEDEITFTWSIDFLTYEALEPIVQTSAKLYWREYGSSGAFQAITVAGNARSITVSANTFPARDLEVYIDPVLVGYTGQASSHVHLRFRRYADMALSAAAGVSNLNPDSTFAWDGNSYIVAKHDWSVGTDHYDNLLCKFGSFPSGKKTKAIEDAGISCFTIVGGGDLEGFEFSFLNSDFDAAAVTWNTKPSYGAVRGRTSVDNTGSSTIWTGYPYAKTIQTNTGSVVTDAKKISALGLEFLNATGIAIGAIATESDPNLGVKEGYFSVRAPIVKRAILLDITVTSKPQGKNKTSGYVNRHQAQTFQWDLVVDSSSDYSCYGGWTQTSAVFHYRAGTTGSWTDSSISGSTRSKTFSANTLPTGTMQWYVTTTDNAGTTADSDIYTVTTSDSATTATPKAPINTLEDGDDTITFSWQAYNGNGTTPTGAELQKSADGTNWSTFATVSGPAMTYAAPAETFSNGTVYWRVRAYNADSVAGNWSSAVSFVCIARPRTPTVSVTARPFAAISWQSDGQQAYRITVDDTVYGPFFGTEISYTLEDFLEDGPHTVKVEIQNSTSLWSKPGEANVTTANVPGNAISLTGKFDRDAVLTWTSGATSPNYYVYRDNVRIGHTLGTGFTDRFVLGRHEYFVINKLSSGNYTRSNLAGGTMRSCTRAVADFNGGEWLEMPLSEDSETEETFAWSSVYTARHVTGSVYPVIERSPYEDGSGSYLISFKDVGTAAEFEALRGKPVILKSRGGNVVIGVLTGYQKSAKNFFLTYQFTLQRFHWRDYIDDTYG